MPRPLAYVAPTSSIPPLQGHQSALIVATSNWNVHNPYAGITCAEDMFNPRSCPYPPPGMSSSLPTGGPALSHPLLQPSYYVGSIGQDFDARAGDQLLWEWQPFGPLWQGGGHPFAQITNGNYVLSLLSYGGSWFYEERTGGHWNYLGGGDIDDGLLWGGKSFAIPIDGRWTVYFGAVQHSDGYWTGGLQLDNVRLRVPEPSALALQAIGFIVLFALAGSGRDRTGFAGTRSRRAF